MFVCLPVTACLCLLGVMCLVLVHHHAVYIGSSFPFPHPPPSFLEIYLVLLCTILLIISRQVWKRASPSLLFPSQHTFRLYVCRFLEAAGLFSMRSVLIFFLSAAVCLVFLCSPTTVSSCLDPSSGDGSSVSGL